MNTEYRAAELEKARAEYAKARHACDSQPAFNGKKRAAAEQLEFWGNRVSFLSCLKAS